jgi:hypothetical protein
VTADDGALIAVDAACDIVRTVSGQTFNQTIGGTIYLDGTGTDCVLLPELPVTAAGTVTVNGTAITDYTLGDNGCLFRGTVGLSDPYWPDDVPFPRVWPAGRRNVRVTYDHGYADADLPRDVRMVALSLASRLIVQGPALQERRGDDSVTYAVANTDLTNGERLILHKYRRPS